MLGQDVEESVKKIILCIRESGGVINNSVVIGIITRVLRILTATSCLKTVDLFTLIKQLLVAC